MRQAIVIFLIFAIPKMKGSWMTEYCEDKRKTSVISNSISVIDYKLKSISYRLKASIVCMCDGPYNITYGPYYVTMHFLGKRV